MMRVRLAAATGGDPRGLAVVMIHGFPFSGQMWEPQLAALTDAGFRVIRPDLRGHGRTAAGGAGTTIDAMANDVLRLLDRLQVSRCVLVGHSMGGYVALAAWAQDPERFIGLVLTNSRAGADDDDARAARDALIADVERDGVEVLVDGLLPRMLADAQGSPKVAESARSMIMATGRQGAVDALAAMRDRPDRGPILSKISIPVLVIAGAEDGITTPEDAKTIAEAIPESSVHVVAGTGHLTSMEAPDEFNATLVAWCERLRAAAG